MKKLMMMAVILLAGVGSVMAQSDYKRGIFNHVGLNVGAGTEGISVGVAAPVTNFLEGRSRCEHHAVFQTVW